MTKSVEEPVEDWAKKSLDDHGVAHSPKNAAINHEIGEAMKKFPSKKGGKGPNFPDLQLMIEPKKGRYIPVMIEAKGKKGDLAKMDSQGNIVIENVKPDGKPDYAAISKFALNGAVHYAEAIVNGTKSYPEVIAIGVNGWMDASGKLQTEMAVYYVAKDNFCIPKKIDDYTDLSFLAKKNLPEFLDKIAAIDLSEEDKEKKTRVIENQIEIELKNLNQTMQDKLAISENMRVTMVSGMIMAGLGVEGEVAALDVTELKGSLGKSSHDGAIILNRIDDFLASKDLPEEKHKVIMDVLSSVFTGNRSLYVPKNGESPLKTVYAVVHDKIMPYFTSKHHLDFTGRLFNVLNAWVKNPDGAANDVVLTPRYVTDFMARLACVNKDSYVWDYALGSAGFLISSMKLMIADAKEKIKSPAELQKKILKIKHEQLLGIEKLPEVYMLAVLNMILMQDGSANIIHANSLTQFDGDYQQGDHRGKPFPANVFLLNPPYSAPGKGFVFVEKALSRMTHGRAAVLIQENAGSGNGLPYTKRILKHSTLLASIRMPGKLFNGKASVQTAVYVFEVGKPHCEKQIVRFIDFSNDGYARQNKKKASMNANLRDIDGASKRYDEVVNVVLYGSKYLKMLSHGDYVEDSISLAGNDWTIQQHRKIDVMAKFDDIEKGVKDYLTWKVSSVLGCDVDNGSLKLPVAVKYKSFKIGDLYEKVRLGKTKADKHSSTSTTRSEVYSLPLVNAKFGDNGIMFYGKEEHFDSAEMTIDIIQNGQIATGKVYPQPQKTGVLWDAYLIKAKKHKDTERTLIFIACAIEKAIRDRFDRDTKATWDRVKSESVMLPVREDNEIDIDYMESYVKVLQIVRLQPLRKYLRDYVGAFGLFTDESPEESDWEGHMAAFEETEK